MPEPIDSSSTLRPILYRLFEQFVELCGNREQAFAGWQSICSLALLTPVALATVNYLKQRRVLLLPVGFAQILCSKWLLFASTSTALLLCRFPALLVDELNPDEGPFIVAAEKLLSNPNFFSAVDTGTNGPLNIYPLLLPCIFGLSPDYASSRLVALGIILLSAYLFYEALAAIVEESLARIGILPFVCVFPVFNNTELIYYSSELIPVLIIACGFYLSARLFRDPRNYKRDVFLLGLLTGAAFFTKIQSLPIISSTVLVVFVYLCTSGYLPKVWRAALLFMAGAALLVLVNAVSCLKAGVWKDFWTSYVSANASYADIPFSLEINLRFFLLQYLPAIGEIRYFLLGVFAIGLVYASNWSLKLLTCTKRQSLRLTLLALVSLAVMMIVPPIDRLITCAMLAWIAACLAPFYFVLRHRNEASGKDPVRWFGVTAILASAASLFSIYRAHHAFLHYLLFLFLPFCALLAWMLIRSAGLQPNRGSNNYLAGTSHSNKTSGGLRLVALVILSTLVYQNYFWILQDNHTFRNVNASILPPEGEFIRSLTSPTGRIFVWGWTARPYLGSARIAATRDLIVANCFRSYDLTTSPPWFHPTVPSRKVDAYYEKRTVEDLRASLPELLVDVISRGSWFLNNRKYFGFEQFQDLLTFVRTNYVYLAQFYDQRYFLRRDLAAKTSVAQFSRTCDAQAVRCLGLPIHDPAKQSTPLFGHTLPPVNMPRHALIEIEFTPMADQAPNATVFNNEAVPRSFRGLRFQNMGGDRYCLLVGLGTSWAFSKSVLIPHGKMAKLSIDLNGSRVHLRCNGVEFDDMHIPSPYTDAAGPITVGSWIGGECPFIGSIQFFQISSPNSKSALVVKSPSGKL